jgi:hypothetical protein
VQELRKALACIWCMCSGSSCCIPTIILSSEKEAIEEITPERGKDYIKMAGFFSFKDEPTHQVK